MEKIYNGDKDNILKQPREDKIARPRTTQGGTGSGASSSRGRASGSSGMSWGDYQRYEQDYNTWKQTGKHTDDFGSWSTQSGIDTWKAIRGRAKSGAQAALIGDTFYTLDKDTYDRYERDYATWKKTGKHSDGFDSWADQAQLDTWKKIRNYNNGVKSGKNPSMELQSTINGLDPEVLQLMQEQYRASWKYGTTDEDLARKAQGLPPKSKMKYYKNGTELDNWLYSQGLPSTQGDYFYTLYDAAAQEVAARRQSGAAGTASGTQAGGKKGAEPDYTGQPSYDFTDQDEALTSITGAFRSDWSYGSTTEDKARRRAGKMPKSVEALYTDSEIDRYYKEHGLPPAALISYYVDEWNAGAEGRQKEAQAAADRRARMWEDIEREQYMHEQTRRPQGRTAAQAAGAAGAEPAGAEGGRMNGQIERLPGDPNAPTERTTLPGDPNAPAEKETLPQAVGAGDRQSRTGEELTDGRRMTEKEREAFVEERAAEIMGEMIREANARGEYLPAEAARYEAYKQARAEADQAMTQVQGGQSGPEEKPDDKQAAAGSSDLLDAALGEGQKPQRPTAQAGGMTEQEMAYAHGQGHLGMMDQMPGDAAYDYGEENVVGELISLLAGERQAATREEQMFIDQQIEQNMHELEHIQRVQGKPLTPRARELWIEARTKQLIPEIERRIATDQQTDETNDALYYMQDEGWQPLVENAVKRMVTRGWTREDFEEEGWTSPLEQTVLDYVFNTPGATAEIDPEKVEQMAREQAEAEMADREREKAYAGDPFEGVSDDEIEAIGKRYDKSVTGYYIKRADHDEDPELLAALKKAARSDDDAADAYEIYKRLHGAGSFAEQMMATSNRANYLYDEYGLCAVMTSDEAAMFDRMAAKDPAEAMKFYHGLEAKLRARARKVSEARGESDGPWLGTLISIAHELTGVGAMEGVAALTKTGLATLGYGDGIKPDDPTFRSKYYDAGAIGGTAAQLKKEHGAVWAWLYENGVSVAKNWIRNMTYGELGLLFMGLDVAGKEINEVIDKGGSQGQALALGVIGGFAEYITEEVSLESLLDMKWNGTLKGYFSSLGKQMLTEGSEELGSFCINTLADAIIMGDDSHISELYQQHLQENGGDAKKALRSTLLELAKEGGMDTLGGMFSGGVMGGPTMLINTYQIGRESGAKGGPVATISAGARAVQMYEQAQAEGTVITGKAATEISVDMMRIGMNDTDAQQINEMLQQVAQQPEGWVSDGMREACDQLQKVSHEQRLSAEADNAHSRQLEQEARARLNKLFGNITAIQQDARDALEHKDLAKHAELMRKINEAMQDYHSAYNGEQAAQETRNAQQAVKDNERQQTVKDAAAKVEAEIPASVAVQEDIISRANADEAAGTQAAVPSGSEADAARISDERREIEADRAVIEREYQRKRDELEVRLDEADADGKVEQAREIEGQIRELDVQHAQLIEEMDAASEQQAAQTEQGARPIARRLIQAQIEADRMAGGTATEEQALADYDALLQEYQEALAEKFDEDASGRKRRSAQRRIDRIRAEFENRYGSRISSEVFDEYIDRNQETGAAAAEQENAASEQQAAEAEQGNAALEQQAAAVPAVSRQGAGGAVGIQNGRGGAAAIPTGSEVSDGRQETGQPVQVHSERVRQGAGGYLGGVAGGTEGRAAAAEPVVQGEAAQARGALERAADGIQVEQGSFTPEQQAAVDAAMRGYGLEGAEIVPVRVTDEDMLYDMESARIRMGGAREVITYASSDPRAPGGFVDRNDPNGPVFLRVGRGMIADLYHEYAHRNSAAQDAMQELRDKDRIPDEVFNEYMELRRRQGSPDVKGADADEEFACDLIGAVMADALGYGDRLDTALRELPSFTQAMAEKISDAVNETLAYDPETEISGDALDAAIGGEGREHGRAGRYSGNVFGREGRGNGYDGYSMSNNARAAYENGEMPISRWTKADILAAVAEQDAEKAGLLESVPLAALKDHLLYQSSWHHTSSMYNRTDFYSVDLERAASATPEQIAEWAKEKPARQETERDHGTFHYVEWSGTRNHPKATNRIVTDAYVEKRGSFYYVYDADGNEIVKKKVGSNGTYFESDAEMESRRAAEERRQAEKEERERLIRENSSPVALEWYDGAMAGGMETSRDGNIYRYGEKPSSWEYEIPEVLKGRERLRPKGDGGYELQRHNGETWVSAENGINYSGNVFGREDGQGDLLDAAVPEIRIGTDPARVTAREEAEARMRASGDLLDTATEQPARRGGIAEEQGSLPVGENGKPAAEPERVDQSVRDAWKQAWEQKRKRREQRKARQQRKAEEARLAEERRKIELGDLTPEEQMEAREASLRRGDLADKASGAAKELGDLVSALNDNLQETTVKKPNPTKVLSAVRAMLADSENDLSGVTMDEQSIAERLGRIIEDFRNNTDESAGLDDLLTESRELADAILASRMLSEEEYAGYEIGGKYDALMDLLDERTLKVGPRGREQLRRAYGSLREFRNAVGNDLHIRWVDDDNRSNYQDLGGALEDEELAQLEEAFGGTNTLDIVELAEFVQGQREERTQKVPYSRLATRQDYEYHAALLGDTIAHIAFDDRKKIPNLASYGDRGARAVGDVRRDIGKLMELATEQQKRIDELRAAGNEEASKMKRWLDRSRRAYQDTFKGQAAQEQRIAELAGRNAQLNEENERLARAESMLEESRGYDARQRREYERSARETAEENAQLNEENKRLAQEAYAAEEWRKSEAQTRRAYEQRARDAEDEVVHLRKENERLGARERRKKDAVAKAEELFRAGKTAREYYDETRNDPDSYSHEVARQLNGMRLREGYDVGGRINKKAFDTFLGRSVEFRPQRALKLTFESPVRVFEEVAGRYSRKNSNAENARIYRDRKLMSDAYVEYANGKMSERTTYVAEQREKIREAWEGHGRTTQFDSAAIQLFGEGLCAESNLGEALQDGRYMVIPTHLGGTFVFEKQGRHMRRKAYCDFEKTYVYPNGTGDVVAIDGTLTVDRKGNSVRVTDKNGTVIADIRNGKGLNTDAVMDTTEKLREYYDAALEEQNRILVENGYAPIRKVKGYFPHFMPREEFGIQRFMQALREDNLNTAINGLTATFKPGHPWAAHLQPRLGKQTEYDAIRGFDSYVEAAGDQIYKTPVVQRLRQLENGLREFSKVMPGDPATKKGDMTNAAFVAWLREYTNEFANKKASLDRELESAAGRSTYRISRFITGAFSGASVGGNISSSLSNMVSWLTGASHLNPGKVGGAAIRTVTQNMARLVNEDRYDGFAAKIPYLNRAFNDSDRLDVTRMDRIRNNGSKALYALFTTVDRFAKESIGRAVYDQCMSQGMSEQEAIRRTDDYLIKNFADRGTGQAARVFGIKWLKPFSQFQLEVLNQTYQFRDISNEEFERKLEKAMREVQASDPDAVDWDGLGRRISAHGPREALKKMSYLLLLSLWGMFTRKAMGRDQTWNVIGTAKDALQAVTDIDPEERSAEAIAKAVGGELLESVKDNAPFVSMLFGGGRIPALGGVENAWKGVRSIFDKSYDPDSRATQIIKGVGSLVPGGGQASKAWRGYQAMQRGGQYNAKGTRLQYPVENTPENWIRALAFGPSALQPEGFDFEHDTLSEKKTEQYRELVAGGMSPTDAYGVLSGRKQIEDYTDADYDAAATQLTDKRSGVYDAVKAAGYGNDTAYAIATVKDYSNAAKYAQIASSVDPSISDSRFDELTEILGIGKDTYDPKKNGPWKKFVDAQVGKRRGEIAGDSKEADLLTQLGY